MLTEPIESPDETTLEALLSRYGESLQDVVDSLGHHDVAEAAGVDEGTVDAIESGDVSDLDLDDVATILALREGAPAADTVLSTARDHLLLGMSSAMLTVDRVAADVGGELEPKEVQGKVEGRLPMTLAEYARFDLYIAGAT